MLVISQSEAQYLRSKGRGNDVHLANKTHKSRSKKYFLTENKRSVDLLNKYRRERLVWSSGTPTSY